MKQIFNVATLAILGVVLMAASNISEGRNETSSSTVSLGNFMVMDKASSIFWEGGKITGANHVGTLALKESSLDFNGTILTGGSFVIDMKSIKNTDLNEGSAKKLEGHLKSEDFFGVSNYPTSTFKIKEVKPAENTGEYNVTGDLTIKATTLPISFPVTISWDGDKAIAKAKISVDRADFDVRYGSGRFFDGLGDKAIKDEFTMDVTIVSKMATN